MRLLKIFSPKPTFRAGFALLAASAMWIAACEKEVDLNLQSSGKTLVVEGGIETGFPPIVQLTNSLSFFSRVDLAALSNAFVHDAIVYVSDGSKTVRLKEYQITGGGFSASYYGLVDFQNPVVPPLDSLIVGEVGKIYTLTIEWDGKTYTSSTTIPASTTLDSVWSQRPARQPDSLPTARELYFRYTDPDTPGNCVRYFTSVNGGQFYAGAFGAVFNDEIVNGGSVVNNLPAGYDRGGPPPGDSTGWYFVGDTVTLRWSAIDRASYDFWNSFEFALGSVGNPFASPTRLQTNIRGGALGAWTGYGSQYHTVVIRD